MIKFYDTSSLLVKGEDLFKENEKFVISTITLQELENIKTSKNKSAEVKYAAREILRQLENNPKNYEVCIFDESMLIPIERKALSNSNDMQILATAIWYEEKVCPDNLIFVTNDLALRHIANLFFGEDSIESAEIPVEEEYTGYIEIVVYNDEELAHIYEHLDENCANLLVNQYLIIKDSQGNDIDILKWNGDKLVALNDRNINSKWFGKLKPQDAQQRMAIDSLNSNQLTVIRGLPGSGKSLLGLGYLFSLLEKHEIERIYIFANPIPVADAGKIGFLPGSKNDKILESSIGNFLTAKLGDPSYVLDLVEQGKIILMPAVDVRGVSINSSSGVFMTEAQNTTKDLMKLLVQRIEENTKVVVEGDAAQVDLESYKGKNNGLNALVEACKGSELFGTATLKRIHRSKLAELVENMK